MELHTETPIPNCKATNGDSPRSPGKSISESLVESAEAEIPIPVLKEVAEDCKTVPDGSPIKDHVYVRYQHGFTRPRENAAIIVPVNVNELPIPGHAQPAAADNAVVEHHHQEPAPANPDQHHENVDTDEAHGNDQRSLHRALLCFKIQTGIDGTVLVMSASALTLLLCSSIQNPVVNSYILAPFAVGFNTFNSLVFVALGCIAISMIQKLELDGALPVPQWKVEFLYVMFVIVRSVGYIIICWFWVTMLVVRICVCIVLTFNSGVLYYFISKVNSYIQNMAENQHLLAPAPA